MPASIDSFQVKVYQGDRADALAAGWHPVPPTSTPRARFAFSPHQTDALLTEAAGRVKNAASSALFAVMVTDGGGRWSIRSSMPCRRRPGCCRSA